MTRQLIVNADDLGLSRGVNRGVIRAHEEGIVTSASLMVLRPAAAEAAEWARAQATFSLGLHLDLGEWAYENGAWLCLHEVVPAGDRHAVAAEIARQLETFRSLTGKDPSHLDSHQHVHRDEPARSLVARVGRELGIPVRGVTTRVRYLGAFYGQGRAGESHRELLTAERLIGLVRELPGGATELGCHPAAELDFDSQYREERLLELETLCEPSVCEAIAEAAIELCSFAALRG